SEGKDRDHSQKSDALYGLGQIYWFGNQEIKQDYRKAAEWFEKAAISGNGDAQLILGVIFFQGLANEKNDKKAREWILKAAESGLVVAQYNLAQFYLKGIGRGKSETQAKSWLEKAVQQGDRQSEQLLNLIQAKSLGSVLTFQHF
ncbi:MAG: sel1 repeat family protein, partial [Gammaproteobacteria bacterium]|nr:sel1 repeat family protein [Gammaproteobacteria bacterium]